MNNALGYFILCRVWSRLLDDMVTVDGHGGAMDTVSALKSAVIHDAHTDQKAIDLLLKAHTWVVHHIVPSQTAVTL